MSSTSRKTTISTLPRAGRVSHVYPQGTVAPTATPRGDLPVYTIDLPVSDPIEKARADIIARLETIKRLAWDLRDKYSPAELNAHREVSLAIACGNTPTEEMIEAYANAKADVATHREQLRSMSRATQVAFDEYLLSGLQIGMLTYTRYGVPCGLDTKTKQDIWD